MSGVRLPSFFILSRLFCHVPVSLLPELCLHLSRLVAVMSLAMPTNQPEASPSSRGFGLTACFLRSLAAVFLALLLHQRSVAPACEVC